MHRDDITVGDLKILYLRNADDATLFATTIFQIEELISRMETACRRFSPNTTRMMIVDRAHNNSPELTEIVNSSVVSSYIYLETIISNGDCVDETTRRITISRSTMHTKIST